MFVMVVGPICHGRHRFPSRRVDLIIALVFATSILDCVWLLVVACIRVMVLARGRVVRVGAREWEVKRKYEKKRKWKLKWESKSICEWVRTKEQHHMFIFFLINWVTVWPALAHMLVCWVNELGELGWNGFLGWNLCLGPIFLGRLTGWPVEPGPFFHVYNLLNIWTSQREYPIQNLLK